MARDHDPAWLREMVAALELKLGVEPLERVIQRWALSAAQAARLFGVTRQAFAKWRHSGIPPERQPVLATLDAATSLLERHVKSERIAAVVRRPAELLGGKSLLELASEGQHDRVYAAVRDMFDLRRVQP